MDLPIEPTDEMKHFQYITDEALKLGFVLIPTNMWREIRQSQEFKNFKSK